MEPELKAQLPEHTMIEQMIKEKRALTNARNRLNYKLRSVEGRNHQIKSSSHIQPKGRKVKVITDQEIQNYILKQVKPVKAIPTYDQPLILVADV